MKKLRVTPKCWAKLLQLLKWSGTNEVSCMGISSEEDPLLMEDIMVVEQEVSGGLTDFIEGELTQHIDRMVDKGVEPWRCSRIWIHTHPGATDIKPSGKDEENFSECLADCEWSVMCILGVGDPYVRIQYNGKLKSGMPIRHSEMMDLVVDYRSLVPLREYRVLESQFDSLVTLGVKYSHPKSKYVGGKWTIPSDPEEEFDIDILPEKVRGELKDAYFNLLDKYKAGELPENLLATFDEEGLPNMNECMEGLLGKIHPGLYEKCVGEYKNAATSIVAKGELLPDRIASRMERGSIGKDTRDYEDIGPHFRKGSVTCQICKNPFDYEAWLLEKHKKHVNCVGMVKARMEHYVGRTKEGACLYRYLNAGMVTGYGYVLPFGGSSPEEDYTIPDDSPGDEEDLEDYQQYFKEYGEHIPGLGWVYPNADWLM